MCSIVVLSGGSHVLGSCHVLDSCVCRVGLTCSVVVLLGGSHVLGSCVVGWVSRAR